jgi:hypothetical protein
VRDTRRRRPTIAASAATALCGCLAFLLGAESQTACATHDCDSSSETLGTPDDGGGNVIDTTDLTWESNALDGRWLDFPGQREWLMWFPAPFKGHEPIELIAYISADPTPNQTPGANFTVASGNLAEFRGMNGYAMRVFNETCAYYYLRVVARAGTSAPSPSGDAATSD